MDTNAYIAEEIMTIKETCKFLRISRGTIRKLNIPHLKIRRRTLYRKCDIEIFLLNNMKDCKNEIYKKKKKNVFK
jgi:hypothetical protein